MVDVAVAATDSVRDTVAVLLQGTVSLRDTLELSGRLSLTTATPMPAPPGWFERWGIAALVNALAVLFLGWFVNHRLASQKAAIDKDLEDYKVGPGTVLALLSHRAGALSQVQLESTRALWGRVVDINLKLGDLTAALRSIESVEKGDITTAEELNTENRAAAVVLEKERAFLPPEVYNIAADYFAGVRRSLELVVDKVDARKTPDSKARVESVKAVRNDLSDQQEKNQQLYNALGEKIQELTTPRAPTPPTKS